MNALEIHGLTKKRGEFALQGLELTLPAGYGFTLNNSSLNGRLDTDFPTTEQGGSTISGDGACQIELNGVSAGVHIRQGEQ